MLNLSECLSRPRGQSALFLLLLLPHPIQAIVLRIVPSEKLARHKADFAESGTRVKYLQSNCGSSREEQRQMRR